MSYLTLLPFYTLHPTALRYTALGGYYLSMACDQIVAEDLTVTGSIGVVTAKFNLQELFKRIGR